jgi:hypothetical protein
MGFVHGCVAMAAVIAGVLVGAEIEELVKQAVRRWGSLGSFLWFRATGAGAEPRKAKIFKTFRPPSFSTGDVGGRESTGDPELPYARPYE